MANRLWHWFNQLPLTDPVEHRQARVLQWVLLGWILLASANLLSTFGALLLGAPAPAPTAEPLPPMFQVIFLLLQIAGLLLAGCPLAALVMLRRGRFKLAVLIATLGLLLTHSIATFLLGVNSGAVLIVFQVPIALAGLLAGRRLLLTVAGLSIAIVVAVSILSNASPPLAGFLASMPGPDGSVAAPDAFAGINVSFFIGITIILTILLDRFGTALRDALSNALEREAELRTIRSSLEGMVAERTAALQDALQESQSRAESQARLLEENAQQRMMIEDLSVPVIPISADTLVMPLVGALDSTRLRHLQEQSLRALEQSSARTLVLDITGVPVVDSQVAQGFLTTVGSARLLGAEVLLVGIRPEVAQTIVGLGIDLHSMRTFRDLHSALAHVLKR